VVFKNIAVSRLSSWVQQRMTRILPAHYFHVVFTVPSELHGLVRLNRAPLYDLLIKSAATCFVIALLSLN
jgi:hypothetical protein